MEYHFSHYNNMGCHKKIVSTTLKYVSTKFSYCISPSPSHSLEFCTVQVGLTFRQPNLRFISFMIVRLLDYLSNIEKIYILNSLWLSLQIKLIRDRTLQAGHTNKYSKNFAFVYFPRKTKQQQKILKHFLISVQLGENEIFRTTK